MSINIKMFFLAVTVIFFAIAGITYALPDGAYIKVDPDMIYVVETPVDPDPPTCEEDPYGEGCPCIPPEVGSGYPNCEAPPDPNEPDLPQTCANFPTMDGCPCRDGSGLSHPDCPDTTPPVDPPIDPPVDPNEPTLPPSEGNPTGAALVYSSCYRPYSEPEWGGMSLNNRVSETRFRLREFSVPCDLMHMGREGEITTLYKCEKDGCAAIDSSVSFDGKTVYFTVVDCPIVKPYAPDGLEQYCMGDTSSRLHKVDLETRVVEALPQYGNFDSSPIEVADGRIMFNSTIAGIWPTTAEPFESGSVGNSPSLQLFTANKDMTDVKPASPQDFSGALHPYQLTNGDVAYSFSAADAMFPFDHYNDAAKLPSNEFWIGYVKPDGSDFRASVEAHEQGFVAAHYIAQLSNGDVCFTSYYRGNNHGLGQVQCHPVQPYGVEGPNWQTQFKPDGYYEATTWGTQNDSPRPAKIGFPEGLPNGQMLATVGVDNCSTKSMSPAKMLAWPGPGCRLGLYMTTTIPSQYFGDMVKVIDENDRNEIMARVAEPYSVRYGMDAPTDPGKFTFKPGRCALVSSMQAPSVIHHRPKGPNANLDPRDSKACGLQGCKVLGIDVDANLAGIRFFQPIPNDDDFQIAGRDTWIGYRMGILGDIPLGEDKSWGVELPCDTPFIMAGINADGRVIAKDQLPMSLREGELRKCAGCHSTAHSEYVKVELDGTKVGEMLASDTLPKLFTATPAPTWSADVYPIVSSKCAGLPDGDRLAYQQLVRTFVDIEVPGYTRPLPMLKDIHRSFALQSNFPDSHCTDLTDAEREVIAVWNETGLNF